MFVKVALESFETYGVSVLVFAVVVSEFLETVVSQVDVVILI